MHLIKELICKVLIILLYPKVILLNRLFVILKLNESLNYLCRRKLLILNNTCTVTKLNNKQITQYIAYFDEEISNIKFPYFRIGSSKKYIKNVKLNKIDYLHNYLFHYFNWIFKLDADTIEYIIFKFENYNIHWEPHPTCNRIFNFICLISIKKDLSLRKCEKIQNKIVKDYNKLIFNTEEHTGGNHYIDNLLCIFMVGELFVREDITKFAERKIKKFLKIYSEFPEFNNSYITLLLKKLEIINSNNITIKRLYNQLQNSKKYLGNIYFNDTYIKDYDAKYNKKSIIINKRGIKFNDGKSLEFLYLNKSKSRYGWNGHDHDNDSALYIIDNNKSLISSKGIPFYKMCKARNKLKTIPFIPKLDNKIGTFFIQSFRNIKIPSLTYFINKKYLNFHPNGLFTSACIINNTDIKFIFKSNRKIKLTFYSDYEWFLSKNKIIYKNVQIHNVNKFKINKSVRCTRLYRYIKCYKIYIEINSSNLLELYINARVN